MNDENQSIVTTFFEEIQGRTAENEILRSARVISINSSRGWDKQPPFSRKQLTSPNLLCLWFDDICSEAEARDGLMPFTSAHAEKIIRFFDGCETSLLIHCTAGISRSGAAGEVLNWYFNRYLESNPEDENDFLQNNRQIVPNYFVRKILLGVCT